MALFRSIVLVAGIFASAAAAGSNFAVVVYGQSPAAERYARAAQTRLEQLLGDNGISVIDQAKAEELKKSWRKLSEPGALITAEEFVDNARRFEIAGIYRVYLGLGSTLGLASIHVATATADLRFIGENAQVKAAASSPMGTKGMPPSDGLTEPAAVNNAIQRAVDSAAGKLGLKIMDITNPRLVKFALKRLDAPVPGATEPYPQPPKLPGEDPVAKLARLADDTWTSEQPTCVRKSPDSRMAAVGGYVQSTSTGFGRVSRSFASLLHVVDLDARREVVAFPISAADPRLQKGGSRITDCLFLQSWRYVAAVSQSHVAFFDTECGVELGRGYFDEPFGNPGLSHLRAAENDYLVVKEGARTVFYQIVREQ